MLTQRSAPLRSFRSAPQLLLLLLLLLLMSAPVAVFAQDAGPPPGVEPKADEVLRRMSNTLAEAQGFTFHANDMIDQVLDNGQKVQFTRLIDVAVKRPDKIAANVTGDTEDIRYLYDGKRVMVVNGREQCYALHDVPATIDRMFDHLAAEYGVTAVLSDLMFSNPYEAMTGNVREGRYLGVHHVGDAKCHHLAFRQPGLDWQIWVEDAERAVPRKVVITYKELPGHPQFIALLDKWDLSAKPDDSTFRISPPANMKRVDMQPLVRATTQPARGAGGNR